MMMLGFVTLESGWKRVGHRRRDCRRWRRAVVVCAGKNGLSGLSQVKGWKGFDDEELRNGKVEDVGVDALKRHLIRALEDQRVEAVEAVFEYAVISRSVDVLEAFPYGEVHALIKDCMKRGMWSGGMSALKFLETFHAPVRLSTYAIAAGGLSQANRVLEIKDLVFKLLRKDELVAAGQKNNSHDANNGITTDESGTLNKTRQIATPSPDERICALAANLAVENNRLTIAIEITEEMERFGIKLGPLTYSILIKGFGRKRRTGDVKRQLLKMKENGVKGDLILYNTAIDAFVRGGMLKLAEKVIDRMREKGLEPDAVSYNTLLKGFSKARRMREAFRLKKVMENAGLKSDDVTRNSLIEGCMQTNQISDALRMLDEVMSTEPVSKLDAEIAFTTIVAGLAKMGDLAAAADFMEQMRRNNVTPNVVTFTSIISGALARGDVKRAWSTFRDMEVNGVLADQGTFKAMIAGLCERGGAGSLEVALKLVATMRKRNIDVDADTYNMLINGYQNRTPNEIPGVGRGELNFLLFVLGLWIDFARYVKNRKMKEAEHLLAVIKRLGLEPDVVTYTTLLKGYGKERNMREVRRIFQEMKKMNIEPDMYALNTFLASCVRSGDLTLASRLFKEIKKMNQNPDLYTYTTIISGYATAGRVGDGWMLYREMKRNGIVPNERAIDTLMRRVDPSSLDSLGLQEARTLLQDAKAIGIDQQKIRDYKSLVENLSYMTSETWKEQENFGDDVEDETFIIEDYRNAFFGEDDDDDAEPKASDRIFRKYDWNEIDSSFKMI